MTEPTLPADYERDPDVIPLAVEQLDDLADDWCVPNRDLPMAEAWDIISGLLDTCYAYRSALREARDCIESWGAYAGDYFQEKHDLAGDLATIDRLLDGTHNDGDESG